MVHNSLLPNLFMQSLYDNDRPPVFLGVSRSAKYRSTCIAESAVLKHRITRPKWAAIYYYFSLEKTA